MAVVLIPISISGTHNLGSLAPGTEASQSNFTMLVDGGEIPVNATINNINISLSAGSFDPGQLVVAFSRWLDLDGIIPSHDPSQDHGYGVNAYADIMYGWPHQTTNPDTGLPWTRTELYTYQWGYSVWQQNTNFLFTFTTEQGRVNGMTAYVDYTVPAPTESTGSLVVGDQGTVTVSRAVLFSLNGSPNTNNTSGLFKIAGDLEVTGNAVIGTTSSRLDGLGT